MDLSLTECRLQYMLEEEKKDVTKEVEDQANTRETMIWVMRYKEKPNFNEVMRKETHAIQWN